MGEPYYIGGRLTHSPNTIPVFFPYTGEVFAEVGIAGAEDQARAADSATVGFTETKIIPAYKRAEILRRIADLMEENRDEFVRILIHESGKPFRQAHLEVTRAVNVMRTSAEEAVRASGEIIALDSAATGEGYIGYCYRVPSGPILCITPFNYPLNLACHKIGPAIAAGCSFVLKPSSKTPLSALLLGKLILEAGYPPAAVNVVPCFGENAETLVRDPRFTVLSFTGSPAVGWRLKEIFPGRRIGLELGGNAPAIVHKDADVAYAARRIAEGAVVNAGQSCISVQRVYIHDDIYDECLKKIMDHMRSFVIGDPRKPETDIGSMISDEEARRAGEKVRQAVMRGARLLLGGVREGAVMHPTILERPSPDMGICSSEAFCPVITVDRYSDIDEAVQMMNESRYGLQGCIFTNAVDILQKLIAVSECGTLIVNDSSSYRSDAMPYGGTKLSGIGREGPKYLLEEFMERKLIVVKQFPLVP
ncbi:aldehyde dehydrogenase family protein [Methanorbis rubei]|uniref:Sulfoacetaldehyde dehydrogenase n=1 Tax=Methanorbis rubei TaxID=3028300 RepID=A0AAE4SAY8_9EURY|nr:Sulfoacetaldehyde dehydrogenase [Methanocorpusculaceae archaeon Cs1]